MKKIIVAASAALLLLSSCSSVGQFYGGATGASLGGMFGSAIGGITGGRYGHNVGTIMGMAVGAAVGVAATSPKTYDRSSDYSSTYETYRQNTYASPYADIVVEDVVFYDPNNNSCINAGEQSRLSFVLRNEGNQYVYDLAPVITVTGTKQIYLSPTAIISELAPGGAVRYTAEMVATKKLKDGVAQFAITLSDGDNLYTLSNFDLPTRKN